MNGLQKSMERGCKWSLFLVALSWGNLLAAYLPTIGPTPLRFRTSPALVFKGSSLGAKVMAAKLREAKMNSEESSPIEPPSPSLDVLAVPWFFEAPLTLATAPAWKPGGGEKGLPSAVTLPRREGAQIFPEALVPFFTTPKTSDTNEPPANPKVVEFVPPYTIAHPSSTATYIKE